MIQSIEAYQIKLSWIVLIITVSFFLIFKFTFLNFAKFNCLPQLLCSLVNASSLDNPQICSKQVDEEKVSNQRRNGPLTKRVADSSQPYVRVNLGEACSYSMFAGTTLAFGSSSVVGGDIGIAAASSSYSGLGVLTMDSSGQFSTSNAVTGNIYAADYAYPTPQNMSDTMNAVQRGYNNAFLEKPVTKTYAGAQTIDTWVIQPGIYSFQAAVNLAGSVTLNGSCGDLFVFQITLVFFLRPKSWQ